MKKVLALVLAVVLAFGMTTVAFAATKVANLSFADSGTGALTEARGDKVSKIYTISGVDAKGIDADTATTKLVANTEYFVPVADMDAANPAIVTSLSVLSDIRVRSTVDAGSAYIATKPAFVIKNVKFNGDPTAKKMAFVSFKTADKFNTEAQEIDMSISLYNKSNTEKKITILGEVAYAGSKEVKSYTMIGDETVINFDDASGDVELEFKNGVTFKVNAKGQKALFLRLDTADDALTDKYPDAALDIRYFAGNNKTFRRSGELTIPAARIEGKDGKMVAPFIYENVNGKLVVAKDAKYNTDKEAFVIKANKLGNYVISNKDLKVEEVKEEAPAGDATGAVKNPETGANDFVGMAVALAVVSVAGIAVAKRK